MSTIKNKQVMVSYRVDAFTSKVSVQPALIEALDLILEAENSEICARKWCAQKAAFAKRKGEKKVSAYVREVAFKKVLPKKDMSSYTIDLKTHDISYRIKPSGASTTMTIGGALLHYINNLTSGGAAVYLGKVASSFHQKKENEDNDISFLVRESIIQNVVAESLL